MYRLTRNKARQSAICKKMRDAKARKREALAAEIGPRPAPFQPPDLRRVVIVIDYDFEPVIDVYRLGNSGRIDSYQVSKNGADAGRAGWANFCKRLSVHYPRVVSPLSVE